MKCQYGDGIYDDMDKRYYDYDKVVENKEVQVTYQTRKTVFDHISKHRGES